MPRYCEKCKEMVFKEGATHNHMFSLAFSVDSIFEDGVECMKNEGDEVIARLVERVADIIREGAYDSEGFGCEDTFRIEADCNG
mgnify:CR=1 FL=1|jgi:hypothetical protein|tara:strand:+ start:1521 stop:1772 length:252 start_codon:yes stop_codon:yes gene_type:complete